MLGIKLAALGLLASFALNGAGACEAKKGAGGVTQANQANQQKAPESRKPQEPVEGAPLSDLKILAQGQQSRVSNAFIVVARDSETYAALRKLVAELPELEKGFFASNAVVAAFLGERRTGGYAVSFKQSGDGGLRVEEIKPPKGSMTIQVITTPFAVAALPLKANSSLAVDAGATWRAAARPFRVRSGEFQMSGGIAGRTEKFEVVGLVGLMREGELATLLFDIKGKGSTKPRALKEVASGIVQSDGVLKVKGLGAGTFVDQPSDALRLSALISARRLSVTFESIPGRIADGYNGRGSLEAESAAGPKP